DQIVSANHAEIKALLEVQLSGLRDAHRKLEELLAAKERHETRVDGRGLLLLAVGIVLTAIPDDLAHYPPLGWTITAPGRLSHRRGSPGNHPRQRLRRSRGGAAPATRRIGARGRNRWGTRSPPAPSSCLPPGPPQGPATRATALRYRQYGQLVRKTAV